MDFHDERESDIYIYIYVFHYVHSASLAMKTDLCSCLGHLQNGCEAVADSLLVFVPYEQAHGACSILKEVGILSPDGIKARAVKIVMKLIANSPGAAKVAPAKMAKKAGSGD